jgi:phospholipase/carboxylesterase
MHLTLPADLAADLVTRGCGRMHPWAETRLSRVRDCLRTTRRQELDTVQSIVAASHA